MTTEPVPQVHRWRAFAVLAVSFFMTIIDLAIVNVALPTIGRKLHVSETDLQWVVTAYGITFGGFLLLGGRAADLLGRRILMLGLAVFTAASLGARLATSGGFLIAMRGLQGLGAAVILPAALSILMNIFPEGAERNKALGLWGDIGAAGATIDLIAGGLLTRYAGWEYIFSSTCRSELRRCYSRRASFGEQAPGGPPPVRPAGRRHRDGFAAAAGLRDFGSAAGRLGIRPHGDAAGRLGCAAGRLPGS
jgi:predicted MFS family arabinose efflux permease